MQAAVFVSKTRMVKPVAVLGGLLYTVACIVDARPLDVEDVLRSQKLLDVEISSARELVAVAVSRPAAIGDNYRAQPYDEVSFVPLRSDLHVISAVDGRVVFSVAGSPDASAFSPRWSPDGARLAFLRRNHAGRLALSVWHAESGYETVVAASGVRGSVPMILQAGRDTAGAFAWLNRNEIVFALDAEEVSDPAVSYAQAIAASDEGRLSVRVWDTRKMESCRKADTLAVVSVENGAISTVDRGDLAAVSVSPTGDAMIVVSVTEYLSPPSDRPLRIPPRLLYSPTRHTPYIGWESRVRVKVDGRWVSSGEPLRGKGAILHETMPRWSPLGHSWVAMQVDDPFAAEPGAEIVQLSLEGNVLERTAFQFRTRAMADMSRFWSAPRVLRTESLADNRGAWQLGRTASNASVTRSYHNGMTTLRASKGTESVQLLQLNQHLQDVSYPSPVPVRYHANGGDRTGWLILPQGASEKPPVTMYAYPSTRPTRAAIMRPEGGTPLLHALLDKGIAIFVADLRIESPGRVAQSQEPVARIVSELDAALTALEADGRVDTGRIAFYGHSFGAYTALTLLSATERFRAIVAYAPLGDLVAHAFAGDRWVNQRCGPVQTLTKQMLHEDPGLSQSGEYDDAAYGNMMMRMGGAPYADFDKYVRNSPLLNLASAATPALVIQGEEDRFSDGERVFNTLHRLGVESTLLYYWGEGHAIEGPDNVRDMVRRTVAWLTGHLAPLSNGEPSAGSDR